MDVSAKLTAYLFSQFRDSTNINAILDFIADVAQDTDDVCNFILDSQSIDDGEGEQLDFLGELIGVQRPPDQETRLFTICDAGEVPHIDNDFKIEEEIDIIFADAVFAGGDVGDFLVSKSGGITIARAEIVTFTALTELGVERDFGTFVVGQAVELESTPATTSTITDIDYYPSGVTYQGGYIGDIVGLKNQNDLEAEASDEYFRYLIRQKAKSFKTRMSRENLFDYLIAFGARCKIDDDTTLFVEIDPIRWQDLDHWTKNYILTKGFKPAGIKIRFAGNTRDGDSI
jgi:hypothetical protein